MSTVPISEDIVVRFSKGTKAEKKKIVKLLIANYMDYVNDFVEKDGDYVGTLAYWKDFIPHTKKIMTPKAFIKKYGKILKPK